MTIKRAPPNMFLSFDDRRKFAALASLFINVDKRKKKSKGKNNGKTKRKYNDIGPWLRGPILRSHEFRRAGLVFY